jgi:hypothetical protein
MKNEQNIATGGTSRTRTPRLKFLMKAALFEPAREARHIEHCAYAEGSRSSNATPATTANNKSPLPFTELILNSPLRA